FQAPFQGSGSQERGHFKAPFSLEPSVRKQLLVDRSDLVQGGVASPGLSHRLRVVISHFDVDRLRCPDEFVILELSWGLDPPPLLRLHCESRQRGQDWKHYSIRNLHDCAAFALYGSQPCSCEPLVSLPFGMQLISIARYVEIELVKLLMAGVIRIFGILSSFVDLLEILQTLCSLTICVNLV